MGRAGYGFKKNPVLAVVPRDNQKTITRVRVVRVRVRVTVWVKVKVLCLC